MGFETKRARKLTQTSPRTSPWNCITLLAAPLIIGFWGNSGIWAIFPGNQGRNVGKAPSAGEACPRRLLSTIAFTYDPICVIRGLSRSWLLRGRSLGDHVELGVFCFLGALGQFSTGLVFNGLSLYTNKRREEGLWTPHSVASSYLYMKFHPDLVVKSRL